MLLDPVSQQGRNWFFPLSFSRDVGRVQLLVFAKSIMPNY